LIFGEGFDADIWHKLLFINEKKGLENPRVGGSNPPLGTIFTK